MANSYTSFSTAQYLSPRDVELLKKVHAATKEVAEMVREWRQTIPEKDEELDVSVKALQRQVAEKGELHALTHDLWMLQPGYPDSLGSIPALYIDEMPVEEGQRQVILYDVDEGDPDVLELILTTFMAEAQDVDCWCVTGSRMYSGQWLREFGGFAFLVAKNRQAKPNDPRVIVRWLGVEQWFLEQRRELLSLK
jgi:hypothetical protein